MTSNNIIEVYKQRYETYRHLDKLRWQMLQIAVAVGSLVLAFGKSGSNKPDQWILFIFGFLLIILGFVMERIRHGISMNGIFLKSVGELVGDVDIPQPSRWYKSYSFWVSLTIMALGLLCITIAICRL